MVQQIKRDRHSSSPSRANAVVLGAVVALGALGCGASNAQAPAAPEGQEIPLPSEPEAGSPVALHGQLHVEGPDLVDAAGAVVRLKGMSSMWLNYDSANFAQSKDGLRWMRDNWGLTVFRAAMGAEATERGSYTTSPANREAMLTKVRGVVRNAIELGVYVIIDWHDHHAEDHPEEAAEFFANMAQEFGTYPNVLYETYNEPLQVSWPDVVKPYHEQVLSALRAVDPDNVVILGTPQWSQRVNDVINARVEGDNLMYTVHFYACSHGASIRSLAVAARNAGVPIFVTEWGATTASGGTEAGGQVCAEESDLWHEFMTQANISWAAWKLDGCPDLSCMFVNRQVPASGGWTAESGFLHGHAEYVVGKMLE